MIDYLFTCWPYFFLHYLIAFFLFGSVIAEYKIENDIKRDTKNIRIVRFFVPFVLASCMFLFFAWCSTSEIKKSQYAEIEERNFLSLNENVRLLEDSMHKYGYVSEFAYEEMSLNLSAYEKKKEEEREEEKIARIKGNLLNEVNNLNVERN